MTCTKTLATLHPLRYNEGHVVEEEYVQRFSGFHPARQRRRPCHRRHYRRAFTAIVNSLVGDVLNPLIAATVGKPDFATFLSKSAAAKSNTAIFSTPPFSFLIVASAVYFFIVIPVNRFMRGSRKPNRRLPPPRRAPSASARFPSPQSAAPTAPNLNPCCPEALRLTLPRLACHCDSARRPLAPLCPRPLFQGVILVLNPGAAAPSGAICILSSREPRCLRASCGLPSQSCHSLHSDPVCVHSPPHLQPSAIATSPPKPKSRRSSSPCPTPNSPAKN